MLKKYNILIYVFLLLFGNVVGQQKKDVRIPLDWHMQSFEECGNYGACINKAYDYLKNRMPKQKVIVAVIDGGIDSMHEDLRERLWVNSGEIPGNGLDDDRNGYVDDIHGWNFLGTKSGDPVDVISLEADRLFVKYLKKFENADTCKLSSRDRKEYKFFRDELLKSSPMGQAYAGILMAKRLVSAAEQFDKEMHQKYPGVELKLEHYLSILDKNEKDEWRKASHMYFIIGWSQDRKLPWNEIFEVRKKLVPDAERRYKKALLQFKDERNLVGDDMTSIKDRYYGNANLLSEVSAHGTHVAGIIGANRSNEWGINGIADVELMILRISAGPGDEYDKDVANAIRYAVENGAKIINMSFGKSFSPDKKWVDDAMKLAEKKNVLLVHAVGNSFADIDSIYVYPTKFINSRKVLDNFISVGSSAPDGNPAISSCYGEKNTDLFAPGVDIYSTVLDDNYKKMSGTSMAAPIVSGIAALIWNYFPELSVKDLKKVFLEGVTSRKGIIALKPQDRTIMIPRAKIPFEKLCKTAGIVNAYNSVRLADKLVNR